MSTQKNAVEVSIEGIKKRINDLNVALALEEKKLKALKRTCFRCNSYKIVFLSARCLSDCHVEWWVSPDTGKQNIQTGHVPSVLGLGKNSNYIEFTFCAECGQIQNYKSEV